MFLSIGMLKQKYFLTDIFILSAEKQPIKLSWRKIEWLRVLIKSIETVIQTVSIPNKLNCLKFYFRINICKSAISEVILN